MGIFINRFSEKVRNMFSESYLMELAQSTGFIKYKSKLKPHMFLDVLFFKHPDDSKGSLTDFAREFKLRYGKLIRKQSIHDKFTSHAVNFIKSLVTEQLSKQVTTSIEGLTHFKSIKIKDSTRFQLPDHLKDDYPGSGGGASEAGTHIQFEYDFLKGEISDLNVTDAKRQDTTDASETMQSVKKGDLIIRDLGYFVQEVFNYIIQNGAYLLSKVKPNVSLYDLSGQKIDLEKLHSDMKKKGIDRMEILVTTKQVKQSLRLIAEVLPDQVVNERLAKAKKEAKKKGRQLTDQYKSYASLNLYITNIKEETLPIDSVVKLYRIRWQIELRFKAWKSFCKLHKVKKMKKYRFECQLYAKLLFILLTWEMAYNFQFISWNNRGKLISIHKFYKMGIDQLTQFRQHLMRGGEIFKDYMKNLYETSWETLLSERRKKRVNLEDLIPLIIDNQQVK